MQVLFLAHVPCRLRDAESLRCSYVYDLSLSYHSLFAGYVRV